MRLALPCVVISGYATGEGTSKFVANCAAEKQNFNDVDDLLLSNVGLGTYLGDPDSRTDIMVKDAVKRSIKSGINVIDTAINYRSQKAERSVGRAISELTEEGTVSRDQIFISTKNGYVTNDADVPGDFWEYVNDEYVKKGVIRAGDISSGYHCMTVPYLQDQLARSLKNLNLDCIDLMYLHNAVEGQIRDVSREDLLKKLEAAFELYEDKRKEGVIRYYGMATWECFRVADNDAQFLSLGDVVEMARRIGGRDEHGFRFIQLPFNLYYDQAYMIKNQAVGGKKMSVLEAAKSLDVGVFTSVPLMQGKLLQPGVMPEFHDLQAPLRALQFVRSTPGVLSPLVGQKSDEHLNENLAIMGMPPIPEDEFYDLVERLTSSSPPPPSSSSKPS